MAYERKCCTVKGAVCYIKLIGIVIALLDAQWLKIAAIKIMEI
jgi:hypothetical protein|tara:strand:+ start:232 stop:360 length:129 start_codon:yes stop_codon:yes gene_type:complete